MKTSYVNQKAMHKEICLTSITKYDLSRAENWTPRMHTREQEQQRNGSTVPLTTVLLTTVRVQLLTERLLQ